MSAGCPVYPTALAINSMEQPLEIAEDFNLRVLREGSDRVLPARAIKMVGRRLIARVSENVDADTCVRIDCEDAFLLGEVLGCWQERGNTFVAVELVQALTRLSELATLQGVPGRGRREEPRVIRQSA